MTVEGQTDRVCHIRSIRTVINYCIFKCQLLEKKHYNIYISYLDSRLWSEGQKRKKYIVVTQKCGINL